MYKKKLGQTYYTNRHSCFLLQYHIVLLTKYRRPVLTGAVKELVYQSRQSTTSIGVTHRMGVGECL